MAFSNKGQPVRPGDRVNIVICNFHAIICSSNSNHAFDPFRSLAAWGPRTLAGWCYTQTVPQYVIEREIPGAGRLSEEEIREVSLRSITALSAIGAQIQWLHSYVTEDKVYCIYLAPDEQTIRDHAAQARIPADRISAVRRMIDPAKYSG
jgi:hypothetical protein